MLWIDLDSPCPCAILEAGRAPWTVLSAHLPGSPARLPLPPATRHPLTPPNWRNEPNFSSLGSSPRSLAGPRSRFQPGPLRPQRKIPNEPNFHANHKNPKQFPDGLRTRFRPIQPRVPPGSAIPAPQRPVCALNIPNEPSPKTGQCRCPRRASMPENSTAHSGKPIVPPLWHPFVFRT